MKRNRLFDNPTFNHRLLTLALPMALQNLMLSAVAACDAIMLGRVDQNSMSAVSLASQIQFIENIVFYASVGAASILAAQYWGKGDKRTVQDIFGICIRINFITSVLFWAGCLFIPETLMRVYTNEPELIRIGAKYLRIAGWSYLLTGISETYLTMLKVTDHVSMVAVISSSAVVFNIFFNAVFIFGLLGVPAMGAQGAAVATVISRVIQVSWAVGITFRRGYMRLPLKSWFTRNAVILRDFIKCGLPIAASQFLWGIGFSSYTAILGHMGADAAAANSVSSVIRDLFCCLCNGMANGGGILIGNELGSGNLKRGREYGSRLSRMSVLIGIVTCLLILAVTPLVLWFYKLSPEAEALLRVMMVIMAVYMIGRCINTIVINGVFYSGGDIIFDAVSLAVCMWGIAIPLSLVGAFVLNWPVPLVFACTCVDEVGKLPWVYQHYKKFKWVRDLTKDRPQEASEGKKDLASYGE